MGGGGSPTSISVVHCVIVMNVCESRLARATEKPLNLMIQTAVKEAVNNILILQLTELRTQIQHAEDKLGAIAKDMDTSLRAIQHHS